MRRKITFHRDQRYTNARGQKFGKGVWRDEKGNMIKPGQGVLDAKNKKVVQYNTDGTKTGYTFDQWAEKKQKDHEIRVLQNDRKWAVPYVPEKRMTITTDKDSPVRGATFSENLLDSIAVNANRAGLPFSTALGLAAQESTLGQRGRGVGKSPQSKFGVVSHSDAEDSKRARGISYNGVYSPTLLISNWKQQMENPLAVYNYNSNGYLLDKPRGEKYYTEDALKYAANQANDYQLEDESPLEHGFREYKEKPKKWNPGDPDYPKKVAARADELVNHSPEIKEYMKKNNLHADGGYLEWEKKMAEYKGLTPDNDPTYNYLAFYEENPQRAWAMLDKDSNEHFIDKFKTVYHPTFSDESIYSGKVSEYNPQGLTGGHWQGNTYRMSEDGYKAPVSMDERQQYLIDAEDNGARLLESDGSLPVYDGIPWGGVLPNVTVTPQHAEGGELERQRQWQDLSMREKHEIMKMAVEDGLQDLKDIRKAYNEYACGGYMFGKGGKTAPPDTNQLGLQAVQFFVDKGLTREQAAGLVGNLIRESRLDYRVRNRNGGAFGIGQWLGDRQKTLFRKYGNNPTFENQLDYIWHELNTTHKNGLRHLKASKTVDEAAANTFGYYEFSAGPEGAIAAMDRHGKKGTGRASFNQGIAFANDIYGQYQKANIKFNAPELASLKDDEYIPIPPNPTYYGTPVDYSTMVRPASPVQEEAVAQQPENSSMGLISLMQALDSTNTEQPLATYTPQVKNTNPFVVSAPTSNQTMLDGRWFAGGGAMETDTPLEQDESGVMLPEVEVYPTHLTLDTFYPLVSKYPFTGHSALTATDTSPRTFRVSRIDKRSDDAGYNLVTNNCADATREALEAISGKEMKPFLFTTPGDVQDFFVENFPTRIIRDKQGRTTLQTNISKAEADIVRHLQRKQHAANVAAHRNKHKHGEGGLLTGDDDISYVAPTDNTYVDRNVYPPVFTPELTEEAAIKRANHVYSNYSEAKDNPFSPEKEAFTNIRRYIKDNIWEGFPAGASNCTLSATQWVNPMMPVKSASSIVNSPSIYGYTRINADEAIPGNLLIAKVPNKEIYHTMLITGFAEKNGTYDFNGKKYHYKKGEPLLTYSRGGNNDEDLRKNVPLSVYTKNSDGHTENLFFRHNYPNVINLPEIEVIGKRH